MVHSLRKAFNDYFGMIVDANQLALDRNDNDAFKLVELRRELSKRIAEIQRALDETTVHSQPNETLAALLAEHRAMFSSERGAISGHQAKWTAPAMARDRDGYESDCRKLLKMHQDNHQWRVSKLLPALERQPI
jgi:hypothetical protein